MSSVAIAEILRKRVFPVIGNGAGIVSSTHVDDAASCTLAALERGRRGIYNIVDDEPAPSRDFIPAIAEALGAKPPLHIPVWLGRLLAGDVAVTMMTEGRGSSNPKAKRELGWQPILPSWPGRLPPRPRHAGAAAEAGTQNSPGGGHDAIDQTITARLQALRAGGHDPILRSSRSRRATDGRWQRAVEQCARSSESEGTYPCGATGRIGFGVVSPNENQGVHGRIHPPAHARPDGGPEDCRPVAPGDAAMAMIAAFRVAGDRLGPQAGYGIYPGTCAALSVVLLGPARVRSLFGDVRAVPVEYGFLNGAVT